MSTPVDYPTIRAALLGRAMELAETWLPGGQLVHNEWVCGNVMGGAGDSLKLSIAKGLWHDWAAAEDTPEAGGDLIHLRAQQLGCSDHEAATQLWSELHLVGDGAPRPAPLPVKAAPRRADGDADLVCPVPEDAPSWSWILNHRELGTAAAHWVYHDAAGRMLMVKVRWNLKDGTKTFRPYSLRRVGDRLQWTAKGLPAPRPLYGLNRLAKQPGAIVVVCEGEKAADAASELLPACVCVCSENGAKNAGHADWSPLRGRSVVIWPDHDEPGQAFAREVATITGGAVLDLGRLSTDLQVTLEKGDDAADLDLDARDRVDLDVIVSETAVSTAAPAPVAVKPVKPPRVAVKREPRTGGRNPYAHMVDALVDHIDGLDLRPDALPGWRSLDTGVRTETGETEIAQGFAHAYRLSGEKLIEQELKGAFQVLVNKWRAERRAEIIARVTGKPSSPAGVAELSKWLLALTGKVDPLDLAVMRHWQWMVKRSATCRPVDWHIMPILKSTQHGTGKTTAVEILSSPFDELAFPIDATALTDERKSLIVTTCLIGRWDEMAGSQKADQEALKRAITEKVHVFRELYTMATHMRARSCSFIGSANLPVEVLVQDTTGARRFYELLCVRCDHALMNSIDPLLAWSAVSEDDDAPILAQRAALEQHQAGIKHADLVSLWLRDDNHQKSRLIYRADMKEPQTIPAYDPALGYRLDQWAARFRSWCVGVGQIVPPLPRFNLRLQQEGFVHMRVHLAAGNAGREYRYKAPARLPEPEDRDVF